MSGLLDRSGDRRADAAAPLVRGLLFRGRPNLLLYPSDQAPQFAVPNGPRLPGESARQGLEKGLASFLWQRAQGVKDSFLLLVRELDHWSFPLKTIAPQATAGFTSSWRLQSSVLPRFAGCLRAGALFSLREEGDEGAKRPPCGRLCLPEDVKSGPTIVPGLAFLPSTSDLALEHLRLQGEHPPRLEHACIGFQKRFHARNRRSGHF